MSSSLAKPKQYAIIVAMTEAGLIGCAGALPWHLPEDLQLFKRLTGKATLVMGRRTFTAIGRPLPDRHMIVITTTLAEQPGVTVVPDFATALSRADEIGLPVFFIGGTEVYRSALAIAEQLHVSWIEGHYDGDTWFPPYDRNDWLSCQEEQHSGFRYIHYRRKVLSPET